MSYTVKELATLSGVSIRTLHFYDKIGLLKPSFVGENGYRYYQEEQLLVLQQILFFKELGFELKQIQSILEQSDFDKLNALQAHKKILHKNIMRMQELIKTIEKTINHLEGKKSMKNNELFYGFDSERQKEYEQYIVNYRGLEAEKLLAESKNRSAKWDKDEWDEIKQLGDTLHKELAQAIEQGLKPEAEAVQVIIHRHYQLQNKFYDVSKEVYIGLTELYSQHPDFQKFFDVYHPKMIEFIGKAMRFYANKNL